MLMEPHDLAVASEQLHFKSNWHGPALEVAGDRVVQPPDTHSWKQTLSLPLVCFSVLFCFFVLRVSQKPQLPRCTARCLWRRSGGRDNDNIWSDIIYSVNTLPLLVSIQSRHKVIYLRRQRRTNSCLYSTILMAPWGGKHGCLFLFQWSSSCGWVGWMEYCQHNRNRLC